MHLFLCGWGRFIYTAMIEASLSVVVPAWPLLTSPFTSLLEGLHKGEISEF